MAEFMEIYLGLYVQYILCAVWVNNKCMEYFFPAICSLILHLQI